MQNYPRQSFRPQFGGFSFFPPVIKNLLIINIAVFFLQIMLEGGFLTFQGEPLINWFARTFYLWPLGGNASSIYGSFMPWQLISYMFLHGDLMHLFFNMIMLWMFGVELENTWGSRKFLFMYFIAGITAGLANLLIAPLFTTVGPTIGASGGVYGVLAAFAMVFPDRYIYLWFFVPMRAKYLISGLIMLEILYSVLGTRQGIAHVAHLGGAIIGGVWVLLDRKGSIDRWMARRKHARMSSSHPSDTPREAKFYEFKPDKKDSRASDGKYDEAQKRIDEILDKISVSGYSNLTEEEKRILLDASKHIHPDND
jgi:membrane associated rhomboid family serine protease